MEDNTVIPETPTFAVDLKQVIVREALASVIAVAVTAVTARFINRAMVKATEIRAKRSAATPE